MKIKNRSHKQTHKRAGIGVRRSERFHFFRLRLRLRHLCSAYDLAKTRLSESDNFFANSLLLPSSRQKRPLGSSLPCRVPSSFFFPPPPPLPESPGELAYRLPPFPLTEPAINQFMNKLSSVKQCLSKAHLLKTLCALVFHSLSQKCRFRLSEQSRGSRSCTGMSFMLHML